MTEPDYSGLIEPTADERIDAAEADLGRKKVRKEAVDLIERSDKYFGNGSVPHEYPSEILRDMTAYLRHLLNGAGA